MVFNRIRIPVHSGGIPTNAVAFPGSPYSPVGQERKARKGERLSASRDTPLQVASLDFRWSLRRFCSVKAVNAHAD
jgi:hypothetical protein